MKIAVLGNSHSICIKQGWDRLRGQLDGVEMTFFASEGASLDGLRCEGGALVATNAKLQEALHYSSGGISEIVAGSYDVFLTCGLGRAFPRVPAHLSSAVRNLCLQDWAEASLIATVSAMLRTLTPAPIYAIHVPAAAAGFSRPDAPVSAPYDERFQQAAIAFDRIGVCLLPQPASTLEQNGFTKPEFAVGSTRWTVFGNKPPKLYPATDIVHMNADFGEIVMRAFFARLGFST